MRHGAVSEGVKVDENGYIKVNDILNHRLFSSRCTINDIRRIVALSRQKFTLKTNFLEGYLEIRANRGHTFKKTLVSYFKINSIFLVIIQMRKIC